MREAVIVASSRTGRAKSFRGSFNLTRPDALAAHYFKDHHSAIYMPMGQTAEIVAERYKVSREAQDRYALLSQQRTAAAQREGKFKDEIAPMKATMEVTDKATGQKSKKEVVVDRDECNRPDTTLEGLAKLPPAFKEGGTVTD